MAKALSLLVRLSYLMLILVSIAGAFGLGLWAMNVYRDVMLVRIVISLYTSAVLLVLTYIWSTWNSNWFAKLLYGLLATGIVLGAILMPTTALLSGGPAFLLLRRSLSPWDQAGGTDWVGVIGDKGLRGLFEDSRGTVFF
jgi:hypothetical protein